MHLVQLLLPQSDNTGQPLPAALFIRVREELIDRFGGLTTYSRAPAKGIWLDDALHAQHEDMVVYEVVVRRLDRAWWKNYRKELALAFAQQDLHMRALPVEML